MYLIIWEFEVREGSVGDFEERYGAEGAWAQLFRKAPGYIRSELNEDIHEERTYVVFDYWDTAESYERFKREFADEYRQLDADCEMLTERETHVGVFQVVEPRVASGQ